MNVQINGKLCTVSVTLTRFKAAAIFACLVAAVWLPANSCNQANAKLAVLSKTPSLGQVALTQPILSPYNLTEETKSVLKHWLHYGYENGYDTMMSTYDRTNGSSETSKMFRYMIDSEWRLGGWETMSRLKPDVNDRKAGSVSHGKGQ